MVGINRYSCDCLVLPAVEDLGPNDLVTVLEELLEVRAKWESIGLGLGVPDGTLEAIQLDHPDSQKRLMEVLKVWLNTRPDPSWEGLVQALRRPLVGAETLANKLEMKFCLQTTVEPPPGIMDMHSSLSCNDLPNLITLCLLPQHHLNHHTYLRQLASQWTLLQV